MPEKREKRRRGYHWKHNRCIYRVCAHIHTSHDERAGAGQGRSEMHNARHLLLLRLRLVRVEWKARQDHRIADVGLELRAARRHHSNADSTAEGSADVKHRTRRVRLGDFVELLNRRFAVPIPSRMERAPLHFPRFVVIETRHCRAAAWEHKLVQHLVHVLRRPAT